MATTSNSQPVSPWWRYGPSAAGGFFSVLLTLGLSKWLPRHFAAAIGWAATWFVVTTFLGKYFRPRWQLPRLVNAALTAMVTGITAGVLAYLLQWP